GAGEDRLNQRAADDLARRAFGDRLHGAFGVLDIEEKIADAAGLDPPQHREIDVDGVVVAGQHHAVFRRVPHGAAAPRRVVERRQLVLAAPQTLLQIGRPRPDRLWTAAPWSLGTLAPWASALILPRHINSPLRGTRVRLLGRMP